jgi:hypothetical protein
MAKWKTMEAGEELRTAGRVLRLAVRTFESLEMATPFYEGEILDYGEWVQLRKQVDGFYARAIVEAGTSDHEGSAIKYLNFLRLAGLRRIPEEVPGGGYVYFLRGEGYCKIGQTTNLQQRLNTLKIQLPFKVDLFHAIPTATPESLERQFHKHFEAKRANGEWFKLADEDFAYIKQWTRSFTVVDCALECHHELTAVVLAGLINGRSILVQFANDGALEVVDHCLGGTPELTESLNRQLRRHGTDVFSILQGNLCEQCGAEVRYSEVLEELEESDAEVAGPDEMEDIPF